mmetsp:Transcript_58865/g.68792  ORF Transcript_58865/g.68792 Transcript_58865/m.68792 type:complete len:639 (-) Transcript_58865:877-2793(-)
MTNDLKILLPQQQNGKTCGYDSNEESIDEEQVPIYKNSASPYASARSVPSMTSISRTLAMMEQDRFTKARGRAVAPTITANGSSSCEHLTMKAIESDIAAKSRAKSELSSKRAAAATTVSIPNAQDSLEALERNIVAKSNAGASRSSVLRKFSLSRTSPTTQKAARSKKFVATDAQFQKDYIHNYTDAQLDGDLLPILSESNNEAPEPAVQAFVSTKVEYVNDVKIYTAPDESKIRRFHLRRSLVAATILVVIIVAITVPTSIVLLRSKITPSPSSAPSGSPSFSPTSVRTSIIFDFLSPYSDLSEKPQRRAAQWIDKVDPQALDIEAPNFLSRYALAVLYFSFNGPQWHHCFEGDTHCNNNDKVPFLSSGSECDWWGTFCDEDGVVRRLSPPGAGGGNKLDGTLPDEIGLLHQLEELSYPNNRIRGTIPESIGALTALQELRLYNNQLESPFPQNLFNITSLRQLTLRNNYFTGSIPTTIGNLQNIEEVHLSANQLEGNIPTEIGQMTTLQELFIYQNKLNGTIPEELFQLRQLESVALHSNHFEGTVSSQFHELKNLRELYLSKNMFDGSVPEQLGRLENLKILSLIDNNLGGFMPPEICQLRQTADLKTLSSDCGGTYPQVQCKLHACCTECGDT